MTIKEFLEKCKSNGWTVVDYDRRTRFSVTIPSGKSITKTPKGGWELTGHYRGYNAKKASAKDAYEYLEWEHRYALRLAEYKVSMAERMPEFEALSLYADDEYLSVEPGIDSFIFTMKKAKVEAKRGDDAVAFATDLVSLLKKYKVYFG